MAHVGYAARIRRNVGLRSGRRHVSALSRGAGVQLQLLEISPNHLSQKGSAVSSNVAVAAEHPNRRKLERGLLLIEAIGFWSRGGDRPRIGQQGGRRRPEVERKGRRRNRAEKCVENWDAIDAPTRGAASRATSSSAYVSACASLAMYFCAELLTDLRRACRRPSSPVGVSSVRAARAGSHSGVLVEVGRPCSQMGRAIPGTVETAGIATQCATCTCRRQRPGEQLGPRTSTLRRTAMGDDAMRAPVNEHTDESCTAQDRDTRCTLEQAFIARVTRTAPERTDPVPRGRRMLDETDAEQHAGWT